MILILILFLSLLAANLYLKSNEKKILDKLPFLNQATLEFANAELSLFKDFPNATLTLKEVKLVDSLYLQHKHPLLVAEDLRAAFSLFNWKQKEIELQSIKISGGAFNLFTDSQGYNNLKSIFPTKTNTDTKPKPSRFDLSQIKFKSDIVNIKLENFLFKSINEQNGQLITGEAINLISDLDIRGEKIKAALDFELHLDELTFNNKDGTYLKDSQLSGSTVCDFENNWVLIKPFDLAINDLDFLFEAKINTDKSSTTILNLENKRTKLSKVLPLLPVKIASAIAPYEIDGFFKTKTQLSLKPNYPIKVEVDFSLHDNEVTVKNVPFGKTKLQGHFVNRKYKDGRKEQGNLQIDLREISTQHGVFRLETDHAEISAKSKFPAVIKTQAFVSGPAMGLSEWYKSDKFFFTKGNFELDAKVNGSINNIDQLFLSSYADLKFVDGEMYYKPSNTTIPIHTLELEKRSDNTKFSIVSATLDKDYKYLIEGRLKNIVAVIVDQVSEAASSEVEVSADKLGWTDFVSIFSQAGVNPTKSTRSEKESKKAMKQTIRGINEKFKPRLQLAIDTFEYFDIVDLYKLNTEIHFENDNILVLGDTNFELEQGKVVLTARLDIGHPHETDFDFEFHATNVDISKLLPKFNYFDNQLLRDHEGYPDDFDLDIEMKGVIDDVEGLLPNSSEGIITFGSEHDDDLKGTIVFNPHEDELLSTQITLDGSPYLFDDFFKNDNFFFQDTGRFHVVFDYVGEVLSFDKLLHEASIDLKIEEGAVYYKDVDIIFPINNLELQLEDEIADYKLYMYSDLLERELNIEGDIKNISELLFGNTGKAIATNAKFYSPLINLSHAFDIFETPPDTTALVQEETVDNKLKYLVKGMLNRFNPELKIQLDSFIVNDRITLTDLSTGCRMQDSTILFLEKTDFNFANGHVSAEAVVDISSLEEEPFNLKLETKNLDLASLLYSFEYLGSKSLENAEKLKGKMSFNLDLQGELIDTELKQESINAILEFHLDEFEVKGVDVIDKLARKLFVKRLFKEVKFAPLYNTLKITGSRVDIPQMQIQSTGINLFVEGHVDNQKETNLWFSVPLDNLLRGVTEVIPPSRPYAATKYKVYAEMFTDKKGELKTKFRFNKKKFYKQRGILEQFKLDKKRDQEIRKKLKEEKEKFEEQK